VVLEWVTWLGGIKWLQLKAIKLYITPLWSAHVDSNLPFFPCESPLLQCIIQGIKWYMGEGDRCPKTPITCDVLKRLLDTATHLSLASHLNFEATATSSFLGFLRCCTFTIHPAKAFDPSVHITRSCVKFMPYIHAPSYVILTVPSSKWTHSGRAWHSISPVPPEHVHAQLQPSKAYSNTVSSHLSPLIP